MIAGNGMSTAAGGTGAIGSDGVRNHVTELAGPVQDSFPFLPMGWQVEPIDDQFILGPVP